jgi:uncharacterized membrane protein
MNRANRFLSIDVARGIIMIVMAIDHAVSPWVVNYHNPEIVLPGVPDFIAFYQYPDGWRHLTRLLTHVCAPGFQLLAGMGLAISVFRARSAHTPQWRISMDMAIRGLVLIGLEYLVMVPAYGGNPLVNPWASAFLFLVLCCIGSATLVFSVGRFLPAPLIGFGSFAILLLAPLYAPDAVVPASGQSYLINIWTNIALPASKDSTWWSVMYPILPWVGCFGIGWCLGTLRARSADAAPAGESRTSVNLLTAVGLAFVFLGILLRWQTGQFGDRLGGSFPPWEAEFWTFSKYPPSPAFTFIFMGIDILLVGLLRPVDFVTKPSILWQVPNVFGRVALFFFIVHFWLYGLTFYFFIGPERFAQASANGTLQELQFPLIVGYGVWAAGLIVLWPVCYGYDRLRQRYRTVLRYF